MIRYAWSDLKGLQTRCPHVAAIMDAGHRDVPFYVQEDFSTLAFIRRGTGTKVVGSRKYSISERSVYVIHPGIQHSYESTRRLLLCNFCYRPEIWNSLPTTLQSHIGFHALFHIEPTLRRTRNYDARLVIDKEDFQIFMDHIRVLISLRDPHPAVEITAVARVTEIFARLIFLYEQQHSENNAHALPMKVARVVQWINENISRPFDNREIAGVAEVSQRTLAALFQEVYGISPKEFVLRQRFRVAKNLLLDTELNITEISAACGFADSNYFARRFRENFHMQPREFRKRGKKAKPARAGKRPAKA
ncbi:MAG: helix-turn-helix domain-containing protein [Chthoniobacterales bacterium]|nr:helix-turn-helix domain-containing protein [Chthoniobacterales bacterium]